MATVSSGRHSLGIATTQISYDQSTITSRAGMVTANHRLAAEAGATILDRGGNAIDAIVATAFAVPVVEPAMSGIGGRGYMVIHNAATNESLVIDGHERVPRAARPDIFAVDTGQPMPDQPNPGWGFQIPVVDDANATGHLAVAVPGVLGALAVAHATYGRLPLAIVLAPAMALAADGFEMSVPLSVAIACSRDKLARFPATTEIFLRDGRAPVPGARFVQRDLARTYESIAQHGLESFYRGAIGQALAAEMERAGGILSASDLAEFQPRVWDRPLCGTYRGHRLLTAPEATGGVTLIELMNVLEGFDLASLDAASVANCHLLIEAMRVTFRDRVAFVDDPAFNPVPFRGLIAKDYAGTRRATIDRTRAQETSSPGDPWAFDGSIDAVLPQGPTVPWGPLGGDTTHFTVADRDGMTVSMTQSLIDAFGSGVVVPGTGMLLNSAMHNFNPIPGQLGSIAPWKRASHYGTPTIVLREDGSPAVAIGGAGGTMVPTGIAQILVNTLDRGWSIQDAVAAPRVHCEGWDSLVDGRIDPDVIAELRAMGHRLVVRQPGYAQPAFSRINAIAFDGDGVATSGTDQFGDAGAAAPAS